MIKLKPVNQGKNVLKEPIPGYAQENVLELITKQDKVLSSMRSWLALILFIISLLYIIVVSILAINPDITRKNNESNLSPNNTLLSADYLEDTSGKFTLEEILKTEVAGNQDAEATHWRSSSDFHIGNSRSVWWARIRTDDIKKVDKAEYFSILTPSLEKVDLYMPVHPAVDSAGGADAADITYRLYEGGWGIPRERQNDESFSYPTFQIDNNLAAGRYVYLRLSSIYTQNYTFKIYTNDNLSLAQKLQTAMASFFIGFLLAIGISNFIQYSTLGIITNFYYIIYI